jgi:hypothetical protein
MAKKSRKKERRRMIQKIYVIFMLIVFFSCSKYSEKEILKSFEKNFSDYEKIKDTIIKSGSSLSTFHFSKGKFDIWVTKKDSIFDINVFEKDLKVLDMKESELSFFGYNKAVLVELLEFMKKEDLSMVTHNHTISFLKNNNWSNPFIISNRIRKSEKLVFEHVDYTKNIKELWYLTKGIY